MKNFALPCKILAVLAGLLPCLATRSVLAQTPASLNTAIIYGVHPRIFSTGGNLAGVSAQLSRLKSLGVTVVWLMPVTPIGQATGIHPTVNSPYCVHDFYAINPSYGSGSDLTNLVNTAHGLGIKVILDEVLNDTSWDNALITQHPEYYVHSDGNPYNPNSIVQAFNYTDVAQLNYATTQYGMQTYMTTMLKYWMTTYNVDGFRFDTADDPAGAHATIPVWFWQNVQSALQGVNPNVLLLGEEEDPNLDPTPFALDYGWNLYDALLSGFTGGSASGVQSAWQGQTTGFPVGTLHMNLQDNWDKARDVNVFGGLAAAKAAAAFNFTITGVPLLYNGMEVANNVGGVNTSSLINWNTNTDFPAFYASLIGLRSGHYALQQGGLTWPSNSASGQVLTYDRAAAGEEFLCEINLSASAQSGTIGIGTGQPWTEVTPLQAPGGQAHPQPANFSLKGNDFAFFQRPIPTTLQNRYQGTYINTANGLQCTTVASPSAPNANWLLVPTDSTARFYFLKNQQTNQYLNVESGPLVCSTIQPSWYSAMWQKVPADYTGTYYYLTNRYTGQSINNQNGPLACGTIQSSWYSAMWAL